MILGIPKLAYFVGWTDGWMVGWQSTEFVTLDLPNFVTKFRIDIG